jgi:processive 1,2-diacylglycerol beta-glucosyltransferase
LSPTHPLESQARSRATRRASGGWPRILILSVSSGSGHIRAAEAVQLAIERTCPEAAVVNLDAMAFSNAAFRRVYSAGYFDLVDRAPHLLGYLYDRSDHPPSGSMMDHLRRILQRVNLQRLVDLIVKGRWDLAVSTHFLPVEVIASLRRAGKVSFPQATITTDFDTHHMWVNSPCEMFFTASDEAKAKLATCGVAPESIRVTGIPVHPVFAESKDVAECRRRHALSIDRRVVLQLAGGPTGRVHQSILDAQVPLHVVGVAGRHRRAKEQMEAIPCPSRHRQTVIGFTSEIDELMAAADVIVSKPGGLTSSEALALGKPLVIIDPIPGQETRNSDYLLENGAAIKANNLACLGQKLTKFLTDPGRLEGARESARRLGKPRAAFDVAECLLQMAKTDQIIPRRTFSW